MYEVTSEASDTVADFEREYGPEWWENELWCDAHGFRPSGGGVYARDLNGESLDVLTDADAEEMGITITVEPWWTGAQGSVKPDSGPYSRSKSATVSLASLVNSSIAIFHAVSHVSARTMPETPMDSRKTKTVPLPSS